jgi:hypothetical protein
LGPQETSPPHPSATSPQFIAEGHAVSGTHPELPPQTLGVPPPPHVFGAVHAPQVYALPHPSLAIPQSSPAQAVACGIGVQGFSPPSMIPPSGRIFAAPQTPG